MIFNVKQTHANFDIQYLSRDIDGNFVSIVKAPLQTNGLNVFFELFTSQYVMHFNNAKTSSEKSVEDRYKFKIFESGNQVGEIRSLTKKAPGFLQNYWYLELEIKGQKYTMYEVGFGNKGLYLCFYKDDKELVAIADKEIIVKNFKDNYTVYSLSDEHKEFITLLLIQYDLTHHEDFMETAVYHKRNTIVNTISKEAKTKYDPDFIPKVKAMHGVK